MPILVEFLVSPPSIEVVLGRLLDAVSVAKVLDEGRPASECMGDVPASWLWGCVFGWGGTVHGIPRFRYIGTDRAVPAWAKGEISTLADARRPRTDAASIERPREEAPGFFRRTRGSSLNPWSLAGGDGQTQPAMRSFLRVVPHVEVAPCLVNEFGPLWPQEVR